MCVQRMMGCLFCFLGRCRFLSVRGGAGVADGVPLAADGADAVGGDPFVEEIGPAVVFDLEDVLGSVGVVDCGLAPFVAPFYFAGAGGGGGWGGGEGVDGRRGV